MVDQGLGILVWSPPASGGPRQDAQSLVDHRGFERFAAQQVYYSLESRDAEYELVPLAVDQGLGILVWSPLAGGLVSGKYRRDASPSGETRQLSGEWNEPPCAPATSTSTSIVSYSFSRSRTGELVHSPDNCRVSPDGDASRRYFPDTSPPASGDHTRMPQSLVDRQGLGILVWSPLAGGLVSGKYRRDASPVGETRQLSGQRATGARPGEAVRHDGVLVDGGTHGGLVPLARQLPRLTRRGRIAPVLPGHQPASGDQRQDAQSLVDRYELVLGVPRLQQIVDLLRREPLEAPVVDQGLGILVWSPLAGGLVSGKYRRDASPSGETRQLSGEWNEPPCAPATSTSTSIVSYSFSRSRTGELAAHSPDNCRVSPDGDASRRYFPDTSPPASGDHTRMPSPWSTARGTSSYSASLDLQRIVDLLRREPLEAPGGRPGTGHPGVVPAGRRGPHRSASPWSTTGLRAVRGAGLYSLESRDAVRAGAPGGRPGTGHPGVVPAGRRAGVREVPARCVAVG